MALPTLVKGKRELKKLTKEKISAAAIEARTSVNRGEYMKASLIMLEAAEMLQQLHRRMSGYDE